MKIDDLNVYYGAFHAIKHANLDVPDRHVMALIGPSGCGKSTFLRALNRMHDLTPGARVTGTVTLDGNDIYAPGIDPVTVRHRIGMVFQRPNPFPKSILRKRRVRPEDSRRGQSQASGRDLREEFARGGALGRSQGSLHRSALDLSGGQQQRLCIARVLAVEPEVILMDEPASASIRSRPRRSKISSANSRRITPSSSSPTRCSRPRASPTSRRSSCSAT
jgi:phosphate transport system ATP-binding protein